MGGWRIDWGLGFLGVLGWGGWRFRPYGESLFPDAEKVTQMYGQPIFCHSAAINGKSSLR
jgi:hypothetical protein